MAIKPVELHKNFRGPTTMISAKHNGVENVMSASWVGLVNNRACSRKSCARLRGFYPRTYRKERLFCYSSTNRNSSEAGVRYGGKPQNQLEQIRPS